MVNYNLPLYINEPEVWDEKTCKRMANRRATDGCGNYYPFRGYIGCSQYGIHHYNGGCIRNGEWWQGEIRPLPVIHEDYEIISVLTWGYRIRHQNEGEDTVTQAEIKRFVFLATERPLSYHPENKAKWSQLGKQLLRQVAKRLDLAAGQYEVRFNPGGIAVSGDIILHSDTLYVNMSVSSFGDRSQFYFRSCKSRKDYTGGTNQWMKYEELLDLDRAVKQLASAAAQYV